MNAFAITMFCLSLVVCILGACMLALPHPRNVKISLATDLGRFLIYLAIAIWSGHLML